MTIGICGAGTMGRGIAIASLTAGHPVVLFDVQEQALEKAAGYIAAQLETAVAKGKLSAERQAQAMASFSTTSAVEGLSGANMVIEAIAEILDVKHALLTSIEAFVAPDTIIASNTSSISITALGRCLNDAGRFVGLHFFNPAHIMKLVEVIRGTLTRQDVVDTCIAFATELGKTPVVARDVPGFIVNRVARNYYNEAQRIVMEGAATIPQVDTLMKAIGFRMGPFELMDLIGVDVNLDVTKSQWQQFFYEPRFAPSLLQQQYVDGGLHGKKTGRGFHDYSE